MPALAMSETPSESRKEQGMYAVFAQSDRQIVFARVIAAGYRGQWREGVTLAPLPRNLDAWPEGHGWPDRTVGVSVSDTTRYRVFTYASDLEGSGFRSTGMAFGGVFETFPAQG
jgi:hypothetical protein